MADDDTPHPAPPAPAGPWTRPRWLAWVAVSALATALVVAIVVLAARSGDDRPMSTVAADRPDTTTTSPTTQPPAVDTTAPTTTTIVERPTTTVVPATTTTAPASSCSDSDIPITVKTDKPAYATGEEVAITVLATNVSDRDCVPGGEATVRIVAADGTVVYYQPGALASWPPGARHPAGKTWRDDSHRWDQRCGPGLECTGGQQPPGDYTIEATWYLYGSGSTTIHIA